MPTLPLLCDELHIHRVTSPSANLYLSSLLYADLGWKEETAAGGNLSRCLLVLNAQLFLQSHLLV